jgi:hypothetical protein
MEMCTNIENEIIRLVQEISEDEESIRRAEKLKLPDRVKMYENSLERKLRVLEILQKTGA